ncbi:uncharacterized protein [Leptinotarsa decemlineata]|uniref:uncharacterized protein n=1 Tax=Leptinotarsa decemlineata TaxID=7539 RepID=UPI003D30B553
MTLKMNKSKIKFILKKTKEFREFDEIKNKSLKRVCKQIIHNLSITFYLLFISASLTVLVFIFSPLLVQKCTILEIYEPKTIPQPFWILLQVYCIIFGVFFPIISYDVFYMSIIILLKVRFKILNWKVGVILQGPKEEKSARNPINNWVLHHNYLLNFVAEVNNAFSTPLLLYFGIITLTLCSEALLFTETSNFSDAFRAGLYFSVGLFEFTAFYCLPGELLIDEHNQ